MLHNHQYTRTYPKQGHIVKNILIVEDSPTVIAMYKSLCDNTEANLVEAKSLPEAFDALAYNITPFSLVIVDYELHDSLNGIQFVKCLRKIQTHQESPVIMISSNITESLKKKCQSLDVLKCYKKYKENPYELKTIINQILTPQESKAA